MFGKAKVGLKGNARMRVFVVKWGEGKRKESERSRLV